MKTIAIIVNIFFPGIGTFFIGKPGQAVAQLVLYLIGIVLCFTVIGAIIGIPLCMGAWIWGLVTAAQAPAQPVQVVVVHQNETPVSR